jgi:hypothetical protein
MQRPKFSWSDYFSGTLSPTVGPGKYTSTRTLSGTNAYVLNCLFIDCTSSSYGGAFSCTSVTCLLVESSSFFSCKASNRYGGAIYFSNSDGQCVLHEVCCYDCFSTYTSSSSWGQFAYISVKSDASSKNYVNYSSMSRCVNENSNTVKYNPLCLFNGKIFCPSINISNNRCQGYSAIYCHPFRDSNSVSSSLSYSSFIDNSAFESVCIYFEVSGTEYEIKSCNILRNTQVSSSNGIVRTYGNTMIENSCILENSANCIFYQVNTNYRTTLSNCTVDSTSNNGYLTIRNTVSKSFILALNHMSTQNCHSEHDSAGMLTPIMQTPSPSKKQIVCYTYNKCFYQPRLIDTFSLTSVFIFAFIRPCASFDPLY